MGELIDLASRRHRLMDPLITWQQNRPGLSDSLPAPEPQPAPSAFVNTFLPWEPAALPRGTGGPHDPPRSPGGLSRLVPAVPPARDAAPAPSL